MSIGFRSYQRLFDKSSSFATFEAREAFDFYLAIKKGVIGAMLAQEGKGKEEHAVYYLGLNV